MDFLIDAVLSVAKLVDTAESRASLPRLKAFFLNSWGKSCNMLDLSAINLSLVFFRKPNLNVTFLD
jgi:hypothetical protein